jgi:perosamine synthetase
VGTLADLNIFSFHPVKAITTGEGGVVTTESFETAYRMRCFRNHGVTSDHFQREQQGSWLYEMVELGYNYRLSDLQCALGLSQLERLTQCINRRRAIAHRYDEAFGQVVGVQPLRVRPDIEHAYHLYVVRLDRACLSSDRSKIFAALRAEGIGANVHYLPVHLHPFYRDRFGLGPGYCPNAEAAYERILSLPLFPAMNDRDVEDVIEAVWKVINAYAIDTRAAAAAGAR